MGMEEGENLIYSYRFTVMGDYFEQRNDKISQEESEKWEARRDMLHAESRRNLSASVTNIQVLKNETICSIYVCYIISFSAVL